MPELTMPKMGDAMEEGTIVRWLKKEGDTVADQEPYIEIATEKANIEVPAFQAGKLTRILVKEGETVPVGTPIAILDGDGEPAAATNGAMEAAPAPDATAAPPRRPAPAGPSRRTPTPRAPEPVASARPTGPAAERVKASPLARKKATEYGIDLAQLHGTGPSGRIVEADVEEFRGASAPATRPAEPSPTPTPAPKPARPAVSPGEERPLSPMRRAIARRLTESKQTIPHFYVTVDVDAAPLVALRTQLNSLRPEAEKLSFNDLIVKASAVALTRFPQVNSQLAGDRIRALPGVHVGVAVSLDEGLIVPVIRDCQAKSVTQIAAEIREKAARARAGKLPPEEYSGGSFTVSNLGMYDVEQFVAVINPPEAAILAVGAIRDAAVVHDGQVVPGKRMHLTLSVDHRIVDGAVAAQFLQELKGRLETPLGLLE